MGMGNTRSRKILWASREAVGKCIYCGKRKASNGFKGCKICRKKKSEATSRFIKNNPHIQKEYHLKVRKEVLAKYGNKCTCCGEDKWPLLVIDHVNNDGGRERKELYGGQSGSSHSFFLMLKREEVREDLQILCWNCNAAKSLYGCCPHSTQWIEIVSNKNVERKESYQKVIS